MEIAGGGGSEHTQALGWWGADVGGDRETPRKSQLVKSNARYPNAVRSYYLRTSDQPDVIAVQILQHRLW